MFLDDSPDPIDCLGASDGALRELSQRTPSVRAGPLLPESRRPLRRTTLSERDRDANMKGSEERTVAAASNRRSTVARAGRL